MIADGEMVLPDIDSNRLSRPYRLLCDAIEIELDQRGCIRNFEFTRHFPSPDILTAILKPRGLELVGLIDASEFGCAPDLAGYAQITVRLAR
jgi:hypothetical protein